MAKKARKAKVRGKSRKKTKKTASKTKAKTRKAAKAKRTVVKKKKPAAKKAKARKSASKKVGARKAVAKKASVKPKSAKPKKKASAAGSPPAELTHPDSAVLNEIMLNDTAPASLNLPARSVAANAKTSAVNACVNSEMDASQGAGHWTSNGQMDTDYGFNSHSIRAFLSNVKACLSGRHYKLDLTNNDFIEACVSSKVYRLKLRVDDATK